MDGNKKTSRVASWIFVYAALIVAVVFASQSAETAPRDLSVVSPVVLGGAAPVLAVDSIVRRSDL